MKSEITVSGDPNVVLRFHRICANMAVEHRQWVADLRAAGVKAAHPDDGWVDRNLNLVRFAYPDFNDGVKVGDTIALGWPKYGSRNPQMRLVAVIAFVPDTLLPLPGGGRWLFVDIPEREPKVDRLAWLRCALTGRHRHGDLYRWGPHHWYCSHCNARNVSK